MTTSPSDTAVLFPAVTDAMVEAAIRAQVRHLCAEVSGFEGNREALSPANRVKMKLVLIAALEAAPKPEQR